MGKEQRMNQCVQSDIYRAKKLEREARMGGAARCTSRSRWSCAAGVAVALQTPEAPGQRFSSLSPHISPVPSTPKQASRLCRRRFAGIVARVF